MTLIPIFNVALLAYGQDNLNTLRLRQDGRPFPDDIFKCSSLNENVLISIKISLKFVPKGQINNITALVQIMAWCWPGNKPLSEPMLLCVQMHVTQALWVYSLRPSDAIWRQWSWTTLAQVMACCLMAPSHYLNQYWLIISKVLWQAPVGYFKKDTPSINCWH